MNIRTITSVAGLLVAAAGSAHAATVDVMRLNVNLTVRTEGQNGQTRQVALVNKGLINLARGEPANAPLPTNLALGLTCEESPRIIVFDKNADDQVPPADPLVMELGTATVVESNELVPRPYTIDSHPFEYSLMRVLLNPVGDPDPEPDGNRIRGGELQLIYRANPHGNSGRCPQNAHVSTISGWIDFRDNGVSNKVVAADPGLVIRGVANVVPPLLGAVEETPPVIP